MKYDLDIDSLSDREREVVLLIVKGRSTLDIARELTISRKTVETHRTHINRKLKVSTALELVRRGLLSGVFTLDDIRDIEARSR